MPSPCTDLVIASAQRIARAGPSKRAKNPSPAVSISEPRKRASSCRMSCMVPLEQPAPSAVAELGRLGGRTDDVGEEDGREDALGLDALRPRCRADRDEELLDLVRDPPPITPRNHVRPAGKLDEARARECAPPSIALRRLERDLRSGGGRASARESTAARRGRRSRDSSAPADAQRLGSRSAAAAPRTLSTSSSVASSLPMYLRDELGCAPQPQSCVVVFVSCLLACRPERESPERA